MGYECKHIESSCCTAVELQPRERRVFPARTFFSSGTEPYRCIAVTYETVVAYGESSQSGLSYQQTRTELCKIALTHRKYPHSQDERHEAKKRNRPATRNQPCVMDGTSHHKAPTMCTTQHKELETTNCIHGWMNEFHHTSRTLLLLVLHDAPVAPPSFSLLFPGGWKASDVSKTSMSSTLSPTRS